MTLKLFPNTWFSSAILFGSTVAGSILLSAGAGHACPDNAAYPCAVPAPVQQVVPPPCAVEDACAEPCVSPCEAVVEPEPVPCSAEPVSDCVYPADPVQFVQPVVPYPQPIAPVAAQFVCDESTGVPTTLFYAPEGVLPVIRWVSHYFAGSGYSPSVRCREVSQRFQRYYDAGVLNYITTGVVNRLPVVCVSSSLGGPCMGVLFTLRPDENATQVIQQLFDVSYANAGPLYESGSRIYLDFNEYLNTVSRRP